VVPDGVLADPAVAVTSALLAAFTRDLSAGARESTLELLLRIVTARGGAAGLAERCRARAREGLWILYRELLRGHADATDDILAAIETEPDRLRAFRAHDRLNGGTA
jgi:hypothetical protein